MFYGWSPLLLVEDEKNDIYLFKRVLIAEQITSNSPRMEDGRKPSIIWMALANPLIGAQFPLPVLVLLDLKLPVKTGLQVLNGSGSNRDWKRCSSSS